jgi:DNA-binding transcriptional LysR family regulator
MDETLLLQFPKLLEIGRIRIGGLESLFDKVFPNAMRRFRALKPGVTCDFVSGNTEFLTQAVLQRQLDFAVCGEPLEPSAYHFEPLYTEHIAFIASDAHPLAGRSAISPEELLAYPTVVGAPPACTIYGFPDSGCDMLRSPNLTMSPRFPPSPVLLRINRLSEPFSNRRRFRPLLSNSM